MTARSGGSSAPASSKRGDDGMTFFSRAVYLGQAAARGRGRQHRQPPREVGSSDIKSFVAVAQSCLAVRLDTASAYSAEASTHGGKSRALFSLNANSTNRNRRAQTPKLPSLPRSDLPSSLSHTRALTHTCPHVPLNLSDRATGRTHHPTATLPPRPDGSTDPNRLGWDWALSRLLSLSFFSLL